MMKRLSFKRTTSQCPANPSANKITIIISTSQMLPYLKHICLIYLLENKSIWSYTFTVPHCFYRLTWVSFMFFYCICLMVWTENECGLQIAWHLELTLRENFLAHLLMSPTRLCFSNQKIITALFWFCDWRLSHG